MEGARSAKEGPSGAEASIMSLQGLLPEEGDGGRLFAFSRPQTPMMMNPLVGTVTPVSLRSQYRDEAMSGELSCGTPQRSPVLELRRPRTRNSGRPSSGPGGRGAFFKAGVTNTVSKLSLLDDQKLTSFPIPPPMTSPEGAPAAAAEFSGCVHPENRHAGLHPRTDSWDEYNNELFLVEDYIADTAGRAGPGCSASVPDLCGRKAQFSRKRVSISDLKSRICKNSDSTRLPLRLKSKRKLSLQSSLTLSPQIYPVDGEHNDMVNMAIISEDLADGGDLSRERDRASRRTRSIETTGFYGDSNRDDNSDNGNSNNDDGNLDVFGYLGGNTDQISMHTGATMVNKIEDLLCDMIKPAAGAAYSDKYLSDLPIRHQLKHCVICEKPLYELSALIPSDRDFREIVCGGCTVRYEQASKILEEYEFESSIESLDSLGNSTGSAFDEVPEVVLEHRHKRPKTRKFSYQLINRLQLQLQEGSPAEIARGARRSRPRFLDSSTRVWLNEAKNKLRWRWRVSGLLPRFLVNQEAKRGTAHG
ncbi:AER211Cp [Eremothecium gossypii ATCC 10895]|uniref:AER211Cp n=1 Tax=Eremothecium gossypii (strain ATCC 10895 / CBS 109.51 / FGSC 9923 / NRRL Y-1056) TaxID=284811 RepID=Q756P3_EREGS|nr:AER211Cp [Eremothecium gossypii ATCC 10895]AAS52892.2 AER211Cp [Eremothecium gossypii ATCC 10895]AEY97200.1 FAER211Cp [Eremothecium gossypii FDAG1]